jgi:hypothetical protein
LCLYVFLHGYSIDALEPVPISNTSMEFEVSYLPHVQSTVFCFTTNLTNATSSLVKFKLRYNGTQIILDEVANWKQVYLAGTLVFIEPDVLGYYVTYKPYNTWLACS